MPVETIVIDNASTDETVSYIKENFPEVCLIESKENLGFAKANNIGMRYALDHDADYVFLLNQDAWVEKDTLSKLVQTFYDNENVGIASPIHLNGGHSGMDFWFIHYVPDDFISDAYMQKLHKYYPVEFVNAAAWLVSVDCVRKVGGFDTLLFMHYGEDKNYCQRVIYHKLRIVINTESVICHDRNFYKGNDDRKKMLMKNPYINEKIKYGNINVDIDVSGVIRQQRLSIIKSCLKFSMGKIKEHIKMIKILQQIQCSRTKNKQGEFVWL